MNDAEKTIWEGTPSQVLNLRIYILCVLLCWLVVPIFIAIAKWLKLKCYKFEITTERIRITEGIFSKKIEELELYRVKDAKVIEPFWLRLFSLGNIVLTTSDRSHPRLIIPAVPDVRGLREKLRTHIERMRLKKGVREVDFE
jgi:uncharacterized membrane protein YdbT with pleckstrin-like domain